MQQEFETLAKQILNKGQISYKFAHSSQERVQILTNLKNELAELKAAFQVVLGPDNSTPSSFAIPSFIS